ncbi:hypothetical protein AB0D08_00610 [Kitasatospora sp. NPDC048540]|uniref:hypothetical protein n=1 Tax=Kitasatospora sp. NPDC048540 TaxID=3155634 RepID=UPI003403AD37
MSRQTTDVTLTDRVIEHLTRVTDGATDFELAAANKALLSSVNAVRNGLMNKGLVVARGDRRPSGRGGMATVWVLA